MLHPFGIHGAGRIEIKRPESFTERPTASFRPHRQFRNEKAVTLYELRHGRDEKRPVDGVSGNLHRRVGFDGSATNVLPSEGALERLALERPVRDVAHFNLNWFAGDERPSVRHHQIRHRHVIPRKRSRRNTGKRICKVSHDALMDISVCDRRSEKGILVLFVPFAADDEVGTEHLHRLQALHKRPGSMRIDIIAPPVAVFVSGSDRHPHVLTPRKLRLGEHALVKRDKNLPLELRSVPARPVYVPAMEENAVHLPQTVPQMRLCPLQLIDGEFTLAKQPFKCRHVEHDDKPVWTEAFFKHSTQLVHEVQLRRPDRRIAGEHDLAVYAVGIGHLQRLLRGLDMRFNPLVGVCVRKFDENLRFAARHDAHVYHFIAARKRDAHGQAIHSAEAHRLRRPSPGFGMEYPVRIGRFRPCGILMQRTVVPAMDEVRPLGAVLELGAGENAHFCGARPVVPGALAHFGEQRLRFRRGYPSTPYGILAGPGSGCQANDRTDDCRRCQKEKT